MSETHRYASETCLVFKCLCQDEGTRYTIACVSKALLTLGTSAPSVLHDMGNS
jgi:hypothetical protein